MILLTVVAALVVSVVIAAPWRDVPPDLALEDLPEELRSVSVDFGIVTDPGTDWAAIDARLDEAGVTAVDLNAGRVEFTAFDWPAHPDVAAEPGADHLARASRALRERADGSARAVGLIVDAYVPAWISENPSLAGRSAQGVRSQYLPSAHQLARGEVGDRLVQYVAALGERYDPSQIAVTELFLSGFHFGEEDLALFQEMTGAVDWPRDADGTIAESDPALGAWTSQVIADLLARMRAALDDVRDGAGARIALAVDVRVNWTDPALGDPSSGQDYTVLLEAADRLVLWAYLYAQRPPAEIEQMTAALEDAGFDMSRFTVSVGLWSGRATAEDGGSEESIPAETLQEAVGLAATNGITSVNVSPLSLMTDEDWQALATVWGSRATPTS